VPEVEDSSIREIFMYSYRLIYEMRDKTINILTVAHGKRALTPSDIENLRK